MTHGSGCCEHTLHFAVVPRPFGLALLLVGRHLNNIDLQWQSYAISAFTFASVMVNTQPLCAASAIVAAFYASQALSEQHPRTFCSILATVLLSATLYNEVSGSITYRGLERGRLLLLAIGFLARERLL